MDGEEREESVERIGCWVWVFGPLILVGAVLVGYWRLERPTDAEVVVVDKTVAHTNYREHGLIHWALRHNKISPPPGREAWRLDRDYLGFHPVESDDPEWAERDEIDREHLPPSTDFVYLADTYGVYRADYEDDTRADTHLDYSPRIYGGVDEEEADRLVEFARSGGDVVGEFNTFASPTDGSARESLEELFGVEWTGWAGRRFSDLGEIDRLPDWVHRHWRRHRQRRWTFDGPGWIFAHEDTRIVVLPDGTDIGPDGVQIRRTSKTGLMRGVGGAVPYRFWVDVIEVRDASARVLAEHTVDVTPTGEEKLDRAGIPTSFPAVVVDGISPLRMYIAADLSDTTFNPRWARVAGWPSIQRTQIWLGLDDPDSRFVWAFYVPLMNNVLQGLEAR